MKKFRLFAALGILAVIGWGAFRVFYVASERLAVGKVEGYEIVACETVHSLGSLLSRDARGGFYRIYNSSGDKVFELFSNGFAFDVVITSADQVEFQLNSGETHLWAKPQ